MTYDFATKASVDVYPDISADALDIGDHRYLRLVVSALLLLEFTVPSFCVFFLNDPAPPEIYPLPLPDALPILGVGMPFAAPAQEARRPRTAAERAWDRGDVARAHAAYLAELAARQRDDTAWYNAGTAALAASDFESARANLGHAAASLDPGIRFRALYNLGLVALRESAADSSNRDAHLADAERAYREALLLHPRQLAAKWNLELAVRRHGGGGASRNVPPAGGGGGGAPPSEVEAGGGGGSAGEGQQGGGGGGLTQAQADQI